MTKNWRRPTNTNSHADADADAPDMTSNRVGKPTKPTTAEAVSEFWKYLERYRRLDHSSRVTISNRPINKPQFIDGIWGYVTIDRSYLILLNPHLSSFPVIDAISRQNTTRSAGIVYGTDFSGSKYRLEMRLRGFTWDQSQDLLVLFSYDEDNGYVTCLSLKTLSLLILV
jgi:hypothetical protein